MPVRWVQQLSQWCKAMKKRLSLLLALVMLLTCSSCALISREPADAPVEERKKYEAQALSVPAAVEETTETAGGASEEASTQELRESEEEVFDMPSEDDPLYAPAWTMFEAVSPLFTYFAFSGADCDLDNLSHDDFWLLIAMSAAKVVDTEHKDDDGTVLFNWAEISDYASCLLGAYFAANGINTYDESYSAYSDPRSNTISLSAMAIDGFKTDLLGFWEDTENEGFYIMLVQTDHDHYAEGDTNDYRQRWEVILQAHADDATHILPFDLKGYAPIILEATTSDEDAADESSAN